MLSSSIRGFVPLRFVAAVIGVWATTSVRAAEVSVDKIIHATSGWGVSGKGKVEAIATPGGAAATAATFVHATGGWLACLLQAGEEYRGARITRVRFRARYLLPSPDAKPNRLRVKISGRQPAHAREVSYNARFFATNEWVDYDLRMNKRGHEPTIDIDLSQANRLGFHVSQASSLAVSGVVISYEQTPGRVAGRALNALGATWLDQAPAIDGTDADTAWRDVPWQPLPGPDAAEAGTADFKVGYDVDGLYFLLRRLTTGKPRVTIKTAGGRAWQDDSFQVSLAPRVPGGPVLLYTVCTNTVNISTYVKYPRVVWNGPVHTATATIDGGWQIEMSFPFSAMPDVDVSKDTLFGLRLHCFGYGHGYQGKLPKYRFEFDTGVRQPIPSGLYLLPKGYRLAAGELQMHQDGKALGFTHAAVPGAKNYELVAMMPSDPVVRGIAAAADREIAAQVQFDRVVAGKAAAYFRVVVPEKKEVVAAVRELLVSVKVAPAAWGTPELWPRPKQMQLTAGRFTFADEVAIARGPGVTPYTVAAFAEQMQKLYGVDLQAARTGQITIVLGGPAKTLNPDGFVLSVTPKQVTIHGRGPAGAYYGMRTLLQLVGRVTGLTDQQPHVPAGKITDWPDTANRVHLAVYSGRYEHIHSFSDLEVLKQYIFDTVAGSRYNVYIIQMSRSMNYPSYPHVGHRTRGAEAAVVRGVAEFARNNFIDLVGSNNTPGHANWLLPHFPELREDGDIRTLCTRHPDALKVVTTIYDEVIEATGSRYFHLGMDEVRWQTHRVPEQKRCKRCAGVPKNELLLEYIRKLHAYYSAKGIRLMMFSDMLIPAWNGAGEFQTAKIRDRIPRDIIICPWGQIGDWIAPFKKLGFEVWRINTGFPQSKQDVFFDQGYELLDGDGLGVFTNFTWLTFNHLALNRISPHNYQLQMLNGGGLWHTAVFKESSQVEFFGRYNNLLAAATATTPPIRGGTFRPVPLAGQTNIALDDDTWSGCRPGFDYASFPQGEFAVADVPFVCDARAVAPLAGAAQTVALPQARFRALVLMHTLEVATEKRDAELGKEMLKHGKSVRGLRVGAYTLTYADGTTAEAPLHLGGNIHFRFAVSSNRVPRECRWSWQGRDGAARPGELNISAQQLVWRNPYPEKPVKSLTVTGSKPGVTPLLLALTAVE